MKNPLIPLLFVAAAILGLELYLANQQGTLALMQLTVGWMLTLLVGGGGLAILWQIWIGKIDMSHLFREGADGQASFSRFQFFIFTFVIAMCLFLVVIGDGKKPKFTEAPSSVLMLLGISSGSYLVAKGIAEKDETGKGSHDPNGVVPNPEAALKIVRDEAATQLAALGSEKPDDDASTQQLRMTLKKIQTAIGVVG